MNSFLIQVYFFIYCSRDYYNSNVYLKKSIMFIQLLCILFFV